MVILRLIALEDRIVYDGAVAHAVAGPAAGSHSAVSTDILHADAVPTPPNVLVISENLPNYSTLAQEAKSGTTIVYYDPSTSTLPSLDSQILSALNGQKAGNIGFATEGSQGNIQLLDTLGITANSLLPNGQNQAILNFWNDVSSNILPNGSIDLFGSNIAEGSEGHALLSQFNTFLSSVNRSISVDASSSAVGASNLGGSWTLDQSSTGADIDSTALFFNESSLSQWDELTTPHINISTAAPLSTSDSGGHSTFDVSLSSQPTSTVTIPLSVSNPTSESLSVSSLTYSPSNWNIPQAVTVSGGHDSALPGLSTDSIILGTTASSDSGWNHLPSAALPVIHYDNITPSSANPAVLVVANNIQDLSTFLSGVNPQTQVILYDPASDTLSSIAQDIAQLLGSAKASNIGFVSSGNSGSFDILNSEALNATTIQQADMIQFWHGIAADLTSTGNIDLLGCNVAEGSTGEALIQALGVLVNQNAPHITVDASSQLVGAPSLGGSWTLDYAVGPGALPVNTEAIYFDNAISQWNETLFSVAFSNFASPVIANNFTLNGSAASQSNPVFAEGQYVLRLTNTAGNEAGGAFLNAPVSMSAGDTFSAYFTFNLNTGGGISDPDGTTTVGADGIVFVLASSTTGLGGSGGQIGYAGVSSSVGVVFDTYDNSNTGDINGNHVGFVQSGSINPELDQVAIATPMNNGATWYAWVDYNGTTLSLYLSQTSTRPSTATDSEPINIAQTIGTNRVYVGFTAGTGQAWNNQDILALNFTNTYNPYGNGGAAGSGGGGSNPTVSVGSDTVSEGPANGTNNLLLLSH